MKAFLQDAFSAYGATVSDADGVLAAGFPEEGDGAELAKKLGRSEVELVFDARSTNLSAPARGSATHP